MQHLTLDEVKAVLAATGDGQERLAFLVAFWHGLRASEVCNLTGANIQDGIVDVKRLKGSLHTRQPFIHHSDPMLDEYEPLTALAVAANADPKQRLFPWSRFKLYRLFQNACKEAGIPKTKRHPHILKHSIAQAIIHEAGIEYTRQYLGHTNIASTGEYVKVSDESAAAKVMAVMGGK